jgi:hypothetical protein
MVGFAQEASALTTVAVHLGPDRPALRYLESSRPLGQASAALSPADQTKISYAQAELVVHVITTVLDGLGLTHEVWEQGSEIAMSELKAASEESWSPL